MFPLSQKPPGSYFKRHFIRWHRAVRRSKSSLKLLQERNIGIEAAEGGNKRERNGVNHTAPVCVSGYRVTYLTARRWLEQTEVTVSISVSELDWPKPLSFSFSMPLMLLLSPFPGCHYLSLLLKCTSRLLHERLHRKIYYDTL